MLVFYNKRVNLQINEVLLPEDFFGKYSHVAVVSLFCVALMSCETLHKLNGT